jgi:hypothetical protein
MINSPATDTATFLQVGGFGNVGGPGTWPIYVGDEPAQPAECITVFDSPGGGLLSPDESLYEHFMQVRVRAIAYDTGYDKIAAVRDWLAVTTKGKVVGSWHYLGFWVTADIASIGRDQQNRHLLVCNFRLNREPQP